MFWYVALAANHDGPKEVLGVFATKAEASAACDVHTRITEADYSEWSTIRRVEAWSDRPSVEAAIYGDLRWVYAHGKPIYSGEWPRRGRVY